MTRFAIALLIATSGLACDEKSTPVKTENSTTAAVTTAKTGKVVEKKSPTEEKDQTGSSTQTAPPVAEKNVAVAPKVEKPTAPVRANLSEALAKFAPGWMAKDCGSAPAGSGLPSPGIRDELGKKNVLVSYPLSATEPCVMGRRVDVLPDKKAMLHLVVGHHPEGEWTLSVTADHELVHKVIGKETAPDGWTNVDIDLSGYAGQIITIQLINAAHGNANSAGYWAKIEME
jgi:hypothetical protein